MGDLRALKHLSVSGSVDDGQVIDSLDLFSPKSALAKLASLETLDVSKCCLGSAGAIKLVRIGGALSLLKRLKNLVIKHNGIEEAGIRAIVSSPTSSLFSMPSLGDLDIGENLYHKYNNIILASHLNDRINIH